MRDSFDTVVVGGGLVGAAIACGIAARQEHVLILDGDDTDFRASRGNFGLTWIQGKGADFAPYAHLNTHAEKVWPNFERELREVTGVDIGLRRGGGYDLCLTEDEWDARLDEMRSVRAHTNGTFEYEMLEHAELKKRIPAISDEVLGASFSPHDGHVNPLYLLRALHALFLHRGGTYRSHHRVDDIESRNGGFSITTQQGGFEAEHIVLCAGLDNQRLAANLGMHIPVSPLRGQLMITERTDPFLEHACLQVRQTAEGTVQIGDTHEDVGFNDGTTLDAMAWMAQRAVRYFPHLANVQVNRAWGALRVMTPDGCPIYQRATEHPNAVAVSCHSGVTLAALHATQLADWICGDAVAAAFEPFSSERFDVQAH
ncbi:MAG: FAD-dependent oxidoreductase [Pseudomonadota bacterium]